MMAVRQALNVSGRMAVRQALTFAECMGNFNRFAVDFGSVQVIWCPSEPNTGRHFSSSQYICTDAVFCCI